MVMESVDQVLITQFSDMMHFKAQQLRARMRPYVEIRKMVGDTYAYDGLGPVEARQLTGRFNQTQWDDLEHFRRKIPRERFSVTLPIDKYDVEARLTDPQGDYAQQCVHAMERVFDRVVYASLFADVQTGRDFENTVTAAADGVLTVDATGGLTQAKLLELRRNYIDNEVGNDIPRGFVIGITGEEHETLLQIEQLTSRFYTNELPLEKGEIIRAFGMDLIKWGASVTKPLLAENVDAPGVRRCFSMAQGGICVGMSRDWEITIDRRPDYVDTKQVQITGVLGAVRTEGKLIQKLKTTI